MALLTIAEAREALALASANTAVTDAALSLQLDGTEARIIGMYGENPSLDADALDADTLAANREEIAMRKQTQLACLVARLERNFEQSTDALLAHGAAAAL